MCSFTHKVCYYLTMCRGIYFWNFHFCSMSATNSSTNTNLLLWPRPGPYHCARKADCLGDNQWYVIITPLYFLYPITMWWLTVITLSCLYRLVKRYMYFCFQVHTTCVCLLCIAQDALAHGPQGSVTWLAADTGQQQQAVKCSSDLMSFHHLRRWSWPAQLHPKRHSSACLSIGPIAQDG